MPTLRGRAGVCVQATGEVSESPQPSIMLVPKRAPNALSTSTGIGEPPDRGGSATLPAGSSLAATTGAVRVGLAASARPTPSSPHMRSSNPGRSAARAVVRSLAEGLG